MSDSKTVDFGNRKVDPEDKTRLVDEVFKKVADRYDIMNDLMSLGSHRLFKQMAAQMCGARKGHIILDLAGGTGDMSKLLAPMVGKEGQIILSDINFEMMQLGKEKLMNAGEVHVQFCQNAAERLPFKNNSFNSIIIAFGLRNFTNKQKALSEIYRTLKPGGVLVVLEFSHPKSQALRTAYNTFQSLWPTLGEWVAGDSKSYEYLVESIENHPEQKALKVMFEDSGFKQVEYHDLAGGICAIHRGLKAPYQEPTDFPQKT